MSRPGRRTPVDPSPPPADFADAGFTTFALEERDDDRHFKWSLWIAAIVHVVLLVVNFPAFSSPQPVDPPSKKRVFVVQATRFRPPPVDLTPKPPPIRDRKRVPIPDPTPDDPEPIPIEVDTEVVLDTPPIDLGVFIPDRPPEPDSNEPINIGQGVSKPVRLDGPQPQYTEVARRARIEGVVILQSVIDAEGQVRDVKVLRGLPLGLTEEAIKAVSQWRFEPATLRGRPVAVYYNLTVSFNLR